MTNIELRIKSIYESLSTSSKKVAEYFLDHPDDIFNMSIADLAKHTGVSKAAWVRFSKSIGFDGLKDLKKALFSEINKDEETISTAAFSDIGDAENLDDLMQSIKSNNTQAVENTVTLLDSKTVEAAARRIIGAQSVRIFGVGASALVAEDLQTKLLRINKHVFFSSDFHVQLMYASSMSADDTAIIISMSGNTAEILELLKVARSCGTPVIALTKFSKNPLAQAADLVLNTSSPEIPIRSGAMSSRIAQLTAVDVLFSAVAFLDYNRISDYLEKSLNTARSHHQ